MLIWMRMLFIIQRYNKLIDYEMVFASSIESLKPNSIQKYKKYGFESNLVFLV